jgi:hypothetical protein
MIREHLSEHETSATAPARRIGRLPWAADRPHGSESPLRAASRMIDDESSVGDGRSAADGHRVEYRSGSDTFGQS